METQLGDKTAIPGPKGWPLLGSIPDLWLSDPLRMMQRASLEYGDTYQFRFGPYRYVVISRPDDIRHVMLDNHANYHKSPTYAGLKLVLGDGLVTSDGALWKRQRKLVQPAFHRRSLEGFVKTMLRCTKDLVREWAQHSDGHVIDVHEEMSRLTFRIVGLTLFSTDLAGRHNTFGQALAVALNRANRYAEALLPIPAWLPTPQNRRFRAAMKTLDGVIQELIDGRRAQGDLGEDLLGMLMAAVDEDDGSKMNDLQLRDEAMTLLLAGHETVANALTWTWLLLAQNASAADRLAAEAATAFGDNPFGLADVAKLTYGNQVIEESMRLYPPAWVFERVALKDDRIGEYHLPAGTIVAVCTWTQHRLARFWKDPDRFDPERFAPDSTPPDRYAYLPFGAGPRTCIGNAFAMMEAKIATGLIAQNFKLELAQERAPDLDPGITLRPKAGLKMRITKRPVLQS